MPMIGIPPEMQKVSRPTHIGMKDKTFSSPVNQEDRHNEDNRSGKMKTGLSKLPELPDSKDNKYDRGLIDKLNGTTQKSIYTEKKTNKLEKEDFLKMLTFQLQNQDPMQPMDQKKMTSELAQLSQLEQMSGMKDMMEKQTNAQQMQNKFVGVSLIGKQISTKGNSVRLQNEGEKASIHFQLDRPAKLYTINVLDKNHNLVTRIEGAKGNEGYNEVSWDGRTLDGQMAAKGEYRFEVQARGDSGESVNATPETSGRVTGVEFRDNATILLMGQRAIDLKDVIRFQTEEGEAKKNPNSPIQSNPSMQVSDIGSLLQQHNLQQRSKLQHQDQEQEASGLPDVSVGAPLNRPLGSGGRTYGLH